MNKLIGFTNIRLYEKGNSNAVDFIRLVFGRKEYEDKVINMLIVTTITTKSK